MNFYNRICEFNREIEIALREKIEKAENNELSLEGFKSNFRFKALGFDWRGNVVFIDKYGHYYELTSIDEYELCELADFLTK